MNDPAALAPFYPPRVTPAARPLRFPFNLIKLLGNNLEIIPEQAYREPVVISPGPPRMAFFTDPEMVKALLLGRQAEFPKGRVQVDILKPIFGNAMISSEGHNWRWQRSVAAPLFRHEELLQYGPVMSAAADAVIAKWKSSPPDTIHLVNKDMMRAAFHVISNTMLFGGAADVLHALEQGHADYYRGINWWVMYTLVGLPHWLPRPGGHLMRAHEARMRRAVTELVRARRSAPATGEDLLGRMLAAADPESGDRMSDDLLVDNIVSFLMAGYDTTAFALTWTLYLISQSPRWEARVFEEIEKVAGAQPVGAEHVGKLVVLQQVLNESLRLFPTAPIIVRDIRDDTEIEGVRIAGGTIGIIPIYAIHRHQRYWDDPDRFDPDRFSAENPRKPTRFQFLPFGAGPRICIGAAFAMLEATIILGRLVQAARFDVPPGFKVKPEGSMFLLPKNGMPMRVTLRTGMQQGPIQRG